ncbi:uncharacterized protein DNG_10496 [Cephalotrichum gorgonifer]|uniref:Uncharacterized protein n=1 Tax=Cephalotrichum gorgonifer TaxID=2041049 RepID=A0AAE8T0B9_9PEZI|nr:uncharacterized protein DNG_10496 [Cephalotrichum gorgonifer]
MLSPLPSS